MQTEKKDNNIYIKQLDKIDNYLLNIIKRFFDTNNDYIEGTAEHIIMEAVKRAKKEIIMSGKWGVSSVNGKSGDVLLFPSDIGAEPALTIKRSAYNKDFGTTSGTVCEGDDSRLSDARIPLEHTHSEYVKRSELGNVNLGGFTDDDRKKLDSIEEGANKYEHPHIAGYKHIPAGGKIDDVLIWSGDGVAQWGNINDTFRMVSHTQSGFMYSQDKIKLDGIGDGANNYVHPNTHPATMITPDSTHRFVTDDQIKAWNAKAEANLASEYTNGLMSKEHYTKVENMTEYVHPTDAGSKHIPAGGSSSQILRWSADGEAVWGNETAAQWGNITNRPTGNKGQVYYISEDSSPNVKPAYLLVKASVVENEKELKEAKEIEVDFQEVFNSWQRFSHNGATTPANPSEMNQWRYDASTNTVKCTINSVSYIGFISNDKYDEYTLELTISSTDGDDDRIGVVVAYSEDPDGTQHTISALRQTEREPYWMLVYDYLKPTQRIIASQNVVPGDVKGGWSSFPLGCKIRVERAGDLISVFTSPMNSDTILSSSKLSVNLSSATYLNTFKGPKQYGYSCHSQNSSTFSNIKFESGLGDVIYDISNGDTWIRDNNTKSWVIDSDRDIKTDIGIGKFVYSEINKKLFYIDDKRETTLVATQNPSSAKYVHPVTPGSKHIPSGGNSGQILKWNADGEARWEDERPLPSPYVHPNTPGNKHIPSGGLRGQVLGYKDNGEAQWVDLNVDKVTMETKRIKKRGICEITLGEGSTNANASVDLSTLNFSSAATYSAYYINEQGGKEQLPTTTYNSMTPKEIIKASVTEELFKISIIRSNTESKKYRIYYEIYDSDSAVTTDKPDLVKVLNIYPDAAGGNVTFTNYNGQTFTLPKTADVKRWMEEPNDESPKGYGRGIINVDCVSITDFNANPNQYLKDSNGNWKYKVVYQGTWDSNNGKRFSDAAYNAIIAAIKNGVGYIGGHDTQTNGELGQLMGIKSKSCAMVVCPTIKIKKKGLLTSSPWDLGELNTELTIPQSHVSSQFHTGDIWFTFNNSTMLGAGTVDGVAGTSNFYLGTYNNTAYIQAGHSSGIASPDEQKVLANVLFYLANM